jgi:hypothetical protein
MSKISAPIKNLFAQTSESTFIPYTNQRARAKIEAGPVAPLLALSPLNRVENQNSARKEQTVIRKYIATI